ncbi:hypothetical protein BLOT_005630 [Blomia tropicalis]|nr:hypothetical protein BLOT_005630 [Blomia tropicalis]
MIETFVCKCLNVTISGDTDEVSQDEVEYIQRHRFVRELTNWSLVKSKTFGPIKICHDFLCLKRNIGNWQINICAICECETHAIWNNGNNDRLMDAKPADSLDNVIFVSPLLLSDEHKIDKLRSDPNYSTTFGIIMPRDLSKNFSQPNPIIRQHDQESEQPLGSFVDLENRVNEKVKQFLYDEQRNMEERIKVYALKENQNFEQLCQTAQMEKNDFVKIADSIRLRMVDHSSSFDKENNSEIEYQSKVAEYEPLKDRYTNVGRHRHYATEQRNLKAFQLIDGNEDQSYTKQKIQRSTDFDGLFDMDDIDIDNNGRYSKNDNDNYQQGQLSFLDETLLYGEQDTFPTTTKTTQLVRGMDMSENDNLPLSSSGINVSSSSTSSIRTRKVASSVVQTIPYPHQTKANRFSASSQQTPNSLPIKIPHYRSRTTDLDSDESYNNHSNNAKGGESIADRIQKLARSVRNENDLLDDRPRCRLNTGDLLKSRPVLN